MIALRKIAQNTWQIDKEGKMLVPAIIYASDALIEKIKEDKTLEQVKNVACLPGIIKAAYAMPDAHQGYGFSIGGVAAFDLNEGIVSPGGVGYDINCGVRLLTSNIQKIDFMFKRKALLDQLYRDIPSGVGEGGEIKLTDEELVQVLNKGCNWALEKSYALPEDLEKTEDGGCIAGADSKKVSQRAKARGRSQLGTLGSGNHFIEIQEVLEIFNPELAKQFGITEKEQIVIMIHSGSRGLGHQTASDFIQKMEKEYGFSHLPDRELACAPINSTAGKDYLAAMAAAANFAFVNRQLMTYKTRKAFLKLFVKSKLDLVYDVAHNIAKFEEHTVDGKKQTVLIHRKGATRSFGPGEKDLPECYKKTGQPIILPGSMGTASYLLVGTNEAEKVSFASTAHGAGRVHSRTYATRNISQDSLKKQLESKDIIFRAGSMRGLLEEAPEVYKDIDEVARVSHELGIGNLVAKMKPLAVMKG
jgi:tRNA-splicing ligase RtcB (3'-phosphate/5'-hydroxy nucleic acid ligase)